MSDVKRTVNQLAERVRHIEGRTQYAVHSGNPNGLVYGIKGTYCIDYENYDVWLNNSERAGNSWVRSPASLVVTYTRQILWFMPDTPLAVDTDVSATVVYRGADITLSRWDLRVKTAPTGTSLILDVNLGGTSLWNATPADRPTIAIAATSGSGTDFDTATVTDGDVLTVDIDQVGGVIAGGQATLILEGAVAAVVS